MRRILDLYRWAASIHQQKDALELPMRGSYKHPKVLSAKVLSRLRGPDPATTLHDVEFQVFSQFGDDGIIEYLTSNLPIASRRFVEFGVEDYTESNTRYLLIDKKWDGLVIDANERHVAFIRSDPISALFPLTARRAFISAESINGLLEDAAIIGELGLLSIDIDGMDYWVWAAVTAVRPAIVVIEYNAIYGPERPIVTPYQADFAREQAHPSRLYWGASLAALQHLAFGKGYLFAGCNSNGNNAYFIDERYRDHPCITSLKPTFQPASFAEHSIGGRRLRGEEALAVIRGLPVVNVATGALETV